MPPNRLWSCNRSRQGESSRAQDVIFHMLLDLPLYVIWQIFTRHGKLVAVTSQEGVLRAKIRGLDEPKKPGPVAKL